eukprot:363952-Chlamydomonas_euryale.AAC.2
MADAPDVAQVDLIYESFCRVPRHAGDAPARPSSPPCHAAAYLGTQATLQLVRHRLHVMQLPT